MIQTTQNNMFLLLNQNGPFATLDSLQPSSSIFSRQARTMASLLGRGELSTKYRIISNQIFEFLNVRSFAAIQTLLHDQARRQEIDHRAYMLLGNMFGIEGTEREIVSRVNNYSRTADGVIRYLRSKVLANYSSHIEMTNEIDALSSPAELLLIVYDDRYHKKARFEAKRKLILMNLAGSIDQRERETGIENKFAQFLEFLNDHVWSKKAKIGELEIVYLLSTHEKNNFTCEQLK
ncbi:MAG: hypothetical protein MUO63_19775, partial [Desulfobulbaceae bacterium]|nr:hypothetical protein [Desulfobulbaceae bacterium]